MKINVKIEEIPFGTSIQDIKVPDILRKRVKTGLSYFDAVLDRLQDGPRGAQEAPRPPQERPKRPPRAPQEAPRGSQEHPRRLQEGLKSRKTPCKMPC